MMMNTSTVCVDSNIVLRLILGGPQREAVHRRWQQWIQSHTTLIAPSLFPIEITYVIWRYVYQHILTVSEGKQALRTCLTQKVHIVQPPHLHEQTFELCHQLNLSQAYDAHYLAIAKEYNCTFWTIDHKLYNHVSPKLPWVKTI